MVALSIAGALAIFLVYTAIAGGGISTISPSQLTRHPGKVQIIGAVVGPVTGDSYAPGGKHFRMRDIGGKATEPVVYTVDGGALFKVRQHFMVTGRLQYGIFVADRDSIITKCPSKYIPKKNS